MTKKIKDYFNRGYSWYRLNLAKIIFVASSYIVSNYLINLPYINIIASLLLFIPYLITWIVIFILFKPPKESILKVGIMLFIVDFFFAIIHINNALEFLGGASYVMIGTYVVLSLPELKNKLTS